MNTAEQQPALPFEQPPRVPTGVVGFPAMLAAVWLVWNAILGNRFEGRFWMAWAIVVFGLALVIAVAVLPQSMKRVRVDEDGMHVKGELALPAGHIGQIKALKGGNAATQSWPLSRNRGLKMPSRQNLYGGLYGWGPAVGVEEIDHRGERVSTWLIPTRDPHGLAAALEHARDHADTRR